MASSMDNRQFWGRKTYCIITGASQGIGRQIAIDFAKNVSNESSFLLLARNIDNLNETKKLMEEVNSNLNILTHSVNLCKPIGSEFTKLIRLSLTVSATKRNEYELALVVHNAGSLGDITEMVTEMGNIEKLESYLTLNLYSVIILNFEFLKIFNVEETKTELAFLNITSLCGVQPFPSLGYYCIGKSSREMYFGVLAEENQEFTVLSYSPGPVLTHMTDEIISQVQNDDIKQTFVDMKNGSKLLTTQQTVAKLVDILRDRAFVNGGRKDYYNEP